MSYAFWMEQADGEVIEWKGLSFKQAKRINELTYLYSTPPGPFGWYKIDTSPTGQGSKKFALTSSAIKKAQTFEGYWGPRCEEYEEGCPVCEAYKKRDANETVKWKDLSFKQKKPKPIEDK